MSRGISIADKLLISALSVEETKKRFSAEDLVVAAWKHFPRDFGLQGYLDNSGNPIYPNSNRVYAEIMGSKPLRKQGLLRKVGNKMYELTEVGRSKAQQISSVQINGSSSKWALARETVEQVIKLFESKTVQKYRSGNLDQISFFDACGFWGLTPRSNAKELWSQFAEIESVIDSVDNALGPDDIASQKHGSIPYSKEDINVLHSVHRTLQEKFCNEIELIKKRTDERKT